jgi:hypothetical protein
MQKRQSGGERLSPSDAAQAVRLLKEALAIIDRIDRPDIGARLQQVIDTLSDPRRG